MSGSCSISQRVRRVARGSAAAAAGGRPRSRPCSIAVDPGVSVTGRSPGGRAGARRRTRPRAGSTRAASPPARKPAFSATRQDAAFWTRVRQLDPVQAELVEGVRRHPGQRPAATPRPRSAGSVQYDATAKPVDRVDVAQPHRPDDPAVLDDGPAPRRGRPATAPPAPCSQACARVEVGQRQPRVPPGGQRVGQADQDCLGVAAAPGPQRQPVGVEHDRGQPGGCRLGRPRWVGHEAGVAVHVVQDAVAVVEHRPLGALVGEAAAGRDRAGRDVAGRMDQGDAVPGPAPRSRTPWRPRRRGGRRRGGGAPGGRRTRSRRCGCVSKWCSPTRPISCAGRRVAYGPVDPVGARGAGPHPAQRVAQGLHRPHRRRPGAGRRVAGDLEHGGASVVAPGGEQHARPRRPRGRRSG